VIVVGDLSGDVIVDDDLGIVVPHGLVRSDEPPHA